MFSEYVINDVTNQLALKKGDFLAGSDLIREPLQAVFPTGLGSGSHRFEARKDLVHHCRQEEEGARDHP